MSTDQGFQEVGRISHTSFVDQVYCSPARRADPAIDIACDTWNYPWFARMRRSAFIDDYLYAFSDVGVTASHRDTLDQPVAVIPLR